MKSAETLSNCVSALLQRTATANAYWPPFSRLRVARDAFGESRAVWPSAEKRGVFPADGKTYPWRRALAASLVAARCSARRWAAVPSITVRGAPRLAVRTKRAMYSARLASAAASAAFSSARFLRAGRKTSSRLVSSLKRRRPAC